jgi:(p)ppGpp synthase/HD superfamily hydrolase
MGANERVGLLRDFERALALATLLHAAQTRKQTDIPYVSHLIGVVGIVLENGGDRDQAIAALLYDSIEDREASYPVVSTHCGR